MALNLTASIILARRIALIYPFPNSSDWRSGMRVGCCIVLAWKPVPETFLLGFLMPPNFSCALKSTFKNFLNIGEVGRIQVRISRSNGECPFRPANVGGKYLLRVFVAHRLSLLYILRFSNCHSILTPALRQVSFQSQS
jgi:hypothetical protein